MDQVKVYLGVAKKHHFWILIAIVVIIALVVWLKASSSLATKYETDKKTIVGAQESVQKVGSDTYNPRFTEKVDRLHEGLKTLVFDAWQKLYEQQVSLFVWPDLSEYEVGVDLNKLGPDEPIPDYIRVIYNEKISRKQWEQLLEGVHIRKQKVQTQESDADAEEVEERRGIEYEGLVVWSPDRRESIISRYYTQNAVPSSKRIRLAQEDYWLFESLIEVVNTVNAGATDTLKAPIKEILTLDVAQWAIAASLESGASIHIPGKADAATSSGGPMGTSAMPMAPTTGGGAGAPVAPTTGATPAAGGAAGGAATAASTESDKEWLTDRYLDDKGQSLAADATQPFAEFKQVFVYMKFIMDQRRIPELVAAAANARLPIETRQVRFQLKGDGTGGGLFPSGGPMGPGGGGMGPMGPGGGGMGPMGPGGGGMGPMGPMGADAAGGSGGFGAGGFGGLGALQEGGVETTVYDALVELSGVIYLYQLPDVAKLGTGASGAPEKRSFGVPTKQVHPPRSSGTSGGAFMGPSIMPGTMSGSGGR